MRNKTLGVVCHGTYKTGIPKPGSPEPRRQKPDILTPGVKFLSARSRDNPAAAPSNPPLDPSYAFKTDTSMATPLVAGCRGLLDQALRATDPVYTGQSGIRLKALFINGTVTLDAESLQYENGKAEERPWGFGRGELDETRTATRKFQVLAPKGTPGSVVNDALPQGIKTTLCWADEGHEKLKCLFYFTLTQLSTKRVWFGTHNGWTDGAAAADQKKRREECMNDVNNVPQIYYKNLNLVPYGSLMVVVAGNFDSFSENIAQ
ncbi:S8 family serine peptidase [Apiospora arundinis]|uniref:S8 family serine peptidase n=1 Tax=Apiospora arundinis TaxID=335852 RepID=A0ABR2I062_9PEZI